MTLVRHATVTQGQVGLHGIDRALGSRNGTGGNEP